MNIDDFLEKDANIIVNRFLANSEDLDLDHTKEKKIVDDVLRGMEEKAREIDPTLQKVIGAEKVKILKTLDQLEKRMIRIVKSSNENKVNRIFSTHQKLFPDHSLQERKDNFMAYYSRYGQEIYLQLLIDNLNPFDRQFIIILDD